MVARLNDRLWSAAVDHPGGLCRRSWWPDWMATLVQTGHPYGL